MSLLSMHGLSSVAQLIGSGQILLWLDKIKEGSCTASSNAHM